MHPNAILVERLFTALHRHDAAAMAECYHQDHPHFHDIAFDWKTKPEICDMWRMICGGDSDIKVDIKQVEADDRRGIARITDTYYFGRDRKRGKEGRPVVNEITSGFTFRDGLIVEHIDTCDPRIWGAQALAWPLGWIAGRLRPVRSFAANRKVTAFVKEHPVAEGRAWTRT